MSDLVLSGVKSVSAVLGRPNTSVFDVPGVGMGGFPRISFRKSRFSVVRSGEEPELIRADGHPVAHLDTIIIGANPGTYKSYYARAYDPNQEAEAPDCYSTDGIAPAPDAMKKQSVTCASCPMNVFGSRVNSQTGAKLKACSDSKRLLVLASDDPAGEVYQVNVSTTALKTWVGYVRELARYGLSPLDVVTRLTMNDAVDYPQVQFKAVMQTPAEAIPAIREKLDDRAVVDFMEGNTGAAMAPPEPPAKEAAPRQEKAPVAEHTGPKEAKPQPDEPPRAAPKEKKHRGFGAGAKTAPSEAPTIKTVEATAPSRTIEDLAAAMPERDPTPIDAGVDALLAEWN